MLRSPGRRIARLLRTLGLTLIAATAGAAVLVPAAHAGVLVETADDCAQAPIEQPFLRWADPAAYVLVPQGTVEETSAWTLAGAYTVAGNEPFFVHGADERRSLYLPAGATATTPVQCVGLEHPTLRFFARNTGSPLSRLRIEVLVEDRLGVLSAVPIAELLGGSAWHPTLPMPVLANLLPLLPGDLTPVRFRFTVKGAGTWQVDDVYVDPYRK